MAQTTWTAARAALRETLVRDLERDRRVIGVGLVGSFGRDEADEWSDLDLLVVVGDDELDGWTSLNDAWMQAEVVFAAPQNTRATAASAGSLHVVAGWPAGVDWYVYPRREAGWPVDCAIVVGEDRVERTQLPFGEWNALVHRRRAHAGARRDGADRRRAGGRTSCPRCPLAPAVQLRHDRRDRRRRRRSRRARAWVLGSAVAPRAPTAKVDVAC